MQYGRVMPPGWKPERGNDAPRNPQKPEVTYTGHGDILHPSNRIECGHCGKMGHGMIACRSRMEDSERRKKEDQQRGRNDPGKQNWRQEDNKNEYAGGWRQHQPGIYFRERQGRPRKAEAFTPKQENRGTPNRYQNNAPNQQKPRISWQEREGRWRLPAYAEDANYSEADALADEMQDLQARMAALQHEFSTHQSQGSSYDYPDHPASGNGKRPMPK